MKRTVLATFTLAMLAVPVPATAGGGCHEDGPAQEVATTTVVIEHACFTPAAAVVRTGATVTWDNPSGLPHNISGPAVQLVELPIGKGTTITFDRAGIYPYACMIHPGMSGVVIVRDGAAAAPAAAPAARTTPVAASRETSSNGASPYGWGGAALAVAGAATLVLWRRRGAYE